MWPYHCESDPAPVTHICPMKYCCYSVLPRKDSFMRQISLKKYLGWFDKTSLNCVKETGEDSLFFTCECRFSVSQDVTLWRQNVTVCKNWQINIIDSCHVLRSETLVFVDFVTHSRGSVYLLRKCRKKVDSFTTSLHSPNCLPLKGLQGYYQWLLKTVEIPASHAIPQCNAYGEFPSLYLD